MNARIRYVCIAILAFSAVLSGRAQNLFIHSFDRSGQMKWTNSMGPGAYQVEWKTSLNQSNWQTNGLSSISSTNPVISMMVPMSDTKCFYRVTWTNTAQMLYSVTGAVYYLSEPVSNRELTLMLGNSPLGTTNSGVTGAYSFGGLSNGTYWVACSGDSQYNAASSGAVISNSSISVNIYLTKPMALISPTNNAVLSTNQPTFVWSEFPGSDHYYLRVWNNNTHEQLLSTNVTATTFKSTAPLSDGVTYMWFVSAMDATTNELAESPGSFLFTVQSNNVPPPADAYSLSGTVYYTNAVPGLPVELRSEAFALLNSTTSDVSGAYIFTSLTNGTYLVGTPGNTQYYGNVYYTVTINNSNQQQNLTCSLLLNLLSPADNSTVRPNPPVFAWQSFPGTDHYKFDLRNSSWTLLESTNIVSTNYQTAVSLSNGSRYYWEVSALDGMCQES